jgi:hypothetical protein
MFDNDDLNHPYRRAEASADDGPSTTRRVAVPQSPTERPARSGCRGGCRR